MAKVHCTRHCPVGTTWSRHCTSRQSCPYSTLMFAWCFRQGLARNFLLGFLNISFFLGLEKNISISFFLWEIFRLEIQIFLSFSEIKKYFRKFLFISQKERNEKYLRKKYFLISVRSKNRHRFNTGVKYSLITNRMILPHISERLIFYVYIITGPTNIPKSWFFQTSFSSP